MFAPGQLRVISKEPLSPAGEGGAVKLREVVDCDEWRGAVDASELAECFYCVVSWDDLVADPGSRVLSYRWAEKICPECAVNDPAGVVTQLHGDVNLQFLRTPASGWTMLWVDFLGHLNEVMGLSSCLSSMGKLYLSLTVLPQYFLLGSYDVAIHAVGRGWMHQELAYGSIDVEAIKGLVDIATNKWMDEGNFRFCGNPFYMESVNLINLVKCKRLYVAISMAKNDDSALSLKTIAMMELWAVAKGMEPYRRVVSEGLSSDECKEKVNTWCHAVAQKQLREDAGENLAVLQSSTIAAWCVLLGGCNTNVWDKSDMYYAATKVIGEACGMPVEDPLRDFKTKTQPWPRNEDGTLKFTVEDLDLDVLNRNNEVLRTCWKTIFSVENFIRHLPNDFKCFGAQKFDEANYRLLPPGVHTLGLGPIRTELVHMTGPYAPLKLGRSVGLSFYDENGTKPLIDRFSIGFHNGEGPAMTEEQLLLPFAREHFCEEYL